MSDKMHPMPYEQLLHWLFTEKKKAGTVFGVPLAPPDDKAEAVMYQGRRLSLPFGPAAGPHTQLAQNIVCAYAAGARYFELKTVQIIDGALLHVDKPCISAKQEGYNVEWSSELTVAAAFEEYAKAWFLIHLLAIEQGDDDGFIFNMSVGYDLNGIRSSKIDGYLETMKDASGTAIWREMILRTLHNLDLLEKVSADDVKRISPLISDSVTLSTMHGCPADEIENIATYLMRDKALHTSVKCNPTLLGYDFVRSALTGAGYDYLQLDEAAFTSDLQFDQAVAMIRRLKEAAAGYGMQFGVKLTNTLPVKSYGGLLPGDSYYVSGSALYPLTINVTAKLGQALGDLVHLSYSGGADESNVADLLRAGIWPITVSTRLLKPGGYKNLTAMASRLRGIKPGPIDTVKLDVLAAQSLEQPAKPATQPVRANPDNRNHDDKRRTCYICNNCIDVCPNRANIGFVFGADKYALHLDALCNECGNCADFCPMSYVPYLDKLTIFDTVEALQNSGNEGLAVLDRAQGDMMVRMDGQTTQTKDETITGQERLDSLLKNVLNENPYLIDANIHAPGKD